MGSYFLIDVAGDHYLRVDGRWQPRWDTPTHGDDSHLARFDTLEAAENERQRLLLLGCHTRVVFVSDEEVI